MCLSLAIVPLVATVLGFALRPDPVAFHSHMSVDRTEPPAVTAASNHTHLAQASGPTGSGVVPKLSTLSPDTGPAGTAYPLRITIRGTGFSPTGNIVRFGPATIPDLSALDGQIELSVPKSLQPSGGAPPLVLPHGAYAVTVTTAAGTSNALTFTMTRGP